MRSLSYVPDFGQVPEGRLRTFDFRAFKAETERTLAAAGINWYFLALDVSLNHVKGKRRDAYWQLHLWGVIEDPSVRVDVLKRQIEQLIDASGAVDKPVQISDEPIKPSSIRSIIAYAMMSEFDRREWFLKSRPGRRPFWDTQDRPLLGLPLIELMIFLDSIGPHSRLLAKGVDIESLQRAQRPRVATTRRTPAERQPHSHAKKGGAHR